MSVYGKKHQKTENAGTTDSWHAIARHSQNYENKELVKENVEIEKNIVFSGKNLQGGNFKGENLANSNFSGCKMQEINLAGANLQNVDFSGADLSGADLSGANLDGAILSGAKLIGTNFTGAHMHGVKLVDADLQDAILLDADLDNLSIEELQELIEYLAQYYPHKLNLSRINLTLLDLKRIDLRKVNLKGVDFTGCNFFGVNIYELDLSECIISPAQIEQAIGHQPTAAELQKILAPKKKKTKANSRGIDFSDFFDGRGGLEGDFTKGGIDMKDIVNAGQKIIKGFKKEDTDEKIMENYNDKMQEKSANKENNNEELRKSIEQYKKEVLEQRKEEQQRNNKQKEEINISGINNSRGGMER